MSDAYVAKSELASGAQAVRYGRTPKSYISDATHQPRSKTVLLHTVPRATVWLAELPKGHTRNLTAEPYLQVDFRFAVGHKTQSFDKPEGRYDGLEGG